MCFFCLVLSCDVLDQGLYLVCVHHPTAKKSVLFMCKIWGGIVRYFSTWNILHIHCTCTHQHMVRRCHCCLVPKRSFIVNCELHNLNCSTTNWKQKEMVLFQDLIFLAKCQKFGHNATPVMTIFVALSGCTRSGKSILAKMLEEHLDDVKVVHQDTWPGPLKMSLKRENIFFAWVLRLQVEMV